MRTYKPSLGMSPTTLRRGSVSRATLLLSDLQYAPLFLLARHPSVLAVASAPLSILMEHSSWIARRDLCEDGADIPTNGDTSKVSTLRLSGGVDPAEANVPRRGSPCRIMG
jgi:hypothetical protein